MSHNQCALGNSGQVGLPPIREVAAQGMKRDILTFNYNRIGGLHTIDAGFTLGCATFLQRRRR
jgi:hypothetical protein